MRRGRSFPRRGCWNKVQGAMRGGNCGVGGFSSEIIFFPE